MQVITPLIVMTFRLPDLASALAKSRATRRPAKPSLIAVTPSILRAASRSRKIAAIRLKAISSICRMALKLGGPHLQRGLRRGPKATGRLGCKIQTPIRLMIKWLPRHPKKIPATRLTVLNQVPQVRNLIKIRIRIHSMHPVTDKYRRGHSKNRDKDRNSKR